jgi:nitroreductase
VEPEKLQEILKTANAAPSAGNLQAYEVYVVNEASRLAALARAAGNQEWVAAAPLALVFCSHPARSTPRYGERGKRLYTLQDATIACTFALLAATALGLGAVWVGAFDDDAVARVIHAPDYQIPVAILPIGYATETPESTPRRRLKTLIHEVQGPSDSRREP